MSIWLIQKLQPDPPCGVAVHEEALHAASARGYVFGICRGFCEWGRCVFQHLV